MTAERTHYGKGNTVTWWDERVIERIIEWRVGIPWVVGRTVEIGKVGERETNSYKRMENDKRRD